MAAGKTQVRLLLSAETARPGDTVWAGLQMKMPPEWHTYWRYAGDAGSPTEIQWELPKGVTAGEIQWPIPRKDLATAGDLRLFTYAYDDEVTLLIPLQLPKDLKPGELKIAAQVDWQECKEECVLGNAKVSATLQVGSESKPSVDAPLIETAKQKLPRTGLSAAGSWANEGTDEERSLQIEFAPAETQQKWDFFPYPHEKFEVNGATEQASDQGEKILLRKKIKKSKEEKWPTEIAGILVSGEGEKKTGYEVKIPISATTAKTFPGSPLDSPAANNSLPIIFLFAFLGGLILNIMPCVLPVIALKVFSFVNQSKETPERVRALGLVYGLGVLVSFLALALLAIVAQKAGEQASWGMALQNQQFRVVFTIVVTLVALNLFGVYEIVLGGRVMGAAGNLTTREGFGGAFLNGVLATVLATPCTAPFLGAALAFAFTQPPMLVLLIFLTIGLGLAAPFVVLCWKPGWLKILPRPGVWMEKFKVAMGFPLLATAMWLFWFTAPRFGKNGVLWFGLFLVVLAAAAWVWGEFVQRGTRRRGVAALISLALIASGYTYALEGKLHWRSAAKMNLSEGSLKETPDGIDWKPWSPEAVEKARAGGHPVLVDFTADNCLNCQLNKASSLEIPSTRIKLKEINAVALLGDFTDKDARIATELQRYGRSGVPLVLVFPKNLSEPAIVLPPLLTPTIVLNALEKAAK